MKTPFIPLLIAVLVLAALFWQPLKQLVVATAQRAHDAIGVYMARTGLALFAVVTTKSTTITNRDSTPPVINDGRLERGSLRSSIGYVTAANGDSIASKYILASVPTTAMVRKVLLSCTAITSGAGDVGVYRNTAAGGAVVDVDLFASAQSIASILNNSDVTNESTNYTMALREQPLWQAAGLTADPGGTLDIVLTLTAATTAGGTVGVQVEYVDNGT
jgi:hypothetical protein